MQRYELIVNSVDMVRARACAVVLVAPLSIYVSSFPFIFFDFKDDILKDFRSIRACIGVDDFHDG